VSAAAKQGLAALLLLLWAGGAAAGEADVLAVEAAQESAGTWRFDVTVAHADEGWEHYADKWEVLAPDGTVLGTRVLAHPHEAEQPFTRSLGGVAIPEGINRVIVRAHDSVHGPGGGEVSVEITR
jgi:predicted N-acyltransferase